jgi:hypothetical protein
MALNKRTFTFLFIQIYVFRPSVVDPLVVFLFLVVYWHALAY